MLSSTAIRLHCQRCGEKLRPGEDECPFCPVPIRQLRNPVTGHTVRVEPPFYEERPGEAEDFAARFATYCRDTWDTLHLDPEVISCPGGWWKPA